MASKTDSKKTSSKKTSSNKQSKAKSQKQKKQDLALNSILNITIGVLSVLVVVFGVLVLQQESWRWSDARLKPGTNPAEIVSENSRGITGLDPRMQESGRQRSPQDPGTANTGVTPPGANENANGPGGAGQQPPTQFETAASQEEALSMVREMLDTADPNLGQKIGILEQAAMETTQVAVQECELDPLVVKVKNLSEVTFINSDQTDTILTVPDESEITIPAAGSTTITVDFQFGPGIYTLICQEESGVSPAGLLFVYE